MVVIRSLDHDKCGKRNFISNVSACYFYFWYFLFEVFVIFVICNCYIKAEGTRNIDNFLIKFKIGIQLFNFVSFFVLTSVEHLLVDPIVETAKEPVNIDNVCEQSLSCHRAFDVVLDNCSTLIYYVSF